jgi:hypothetical protein
MMAVGLPEVYGQRYEIGQLSGTAFENKMKRGGQKTGLEGDNKTEVIRRQRNE